MSYSPLRLLLIVSALSVTPLGVVPALAESVTSSQYRRHLQEVVEHANELSGTVRLSRPRPIVCKLTLTSENGGTMAILAIRDRREHVLAMAQIPFEGVFQQTLESENDFHTETTEIQESRWSTSRVRITTFDDVASFDLTITEVDGYTVRCSLSE